MRFLGRRGLELAAGTLVMIIVAIVVLALSLSLTYTIFCAAEEYEATVTSQNRAQINQLLAGGGRVVVPDNAQDARTQGSFLCGSSRSQAVHFVLGVQNRAQGDATFTVEVSRPDTEGDPQPLAPNEILINIEDPQVSGDVVTDTLRLGPGERAVETIVIDLPLGTPSGQYTYLVRVIEGGDALYGAQMIHVIIP